MRVMVLVKPTEDGEKRPPPKEWVYAIMAAKGRFHDHLRGGRHPGHGQGRPDGLVGLRCGACRGGMSRN